MIPDQLEHDKEKVLRTLIADRQLAHRIVFPHRHKNVTPEFHHDLLNLYYSAHPRVALEAFRGAAKSTLIEEATILGAEFRDFKFCIIVGNSYERACERLTAIKREIETNEALIELFGDQVGGTWASDQIVLANGVKIQAFGARQSLRGAKHLDQRPDLALIDDLEDEDMVATEEARRKLMRWVNGALLPALDPEGRIRVVGTPLHPKAFIEEKLRDPAWSSRRFPILNIDPAGREVSAWPERFTLEHINFLRDSYRQTGSYVEFEQEYMCRSEDAAAKPFQVSMIKVQPVAAARMPIQIMVDPARTTKQKTSARTGYAVWAWQGSTLNVLDAFGGFHKPDEIIKHIFELNEKYAPMELGVEVDGLEEFLMQPLRDEQLKRGVSIPLRPLRAPRDKISFITGLQPFYLSGSVIHAKNLPDLTNELLQFPTGRMDVPNALAYALRMRSGRPVYPDFTIDHIVPAMDAPVAGKSRYLLLSSRQAMTAGVLVQYLNDKVVIYADWVRNEPPVSGTESICREAVLAGGGQYMPMIPVEQFDKYTNFGLAQAIKQLRMTPLKTGSVVQAQGCLAPWLQKRINGEPALLVNDAARWTRNALSGGYARRLQPNGTLTAAPDDNAYRLVMETLEAFVSWFAPQKDSIDGTDGRQYARTPEGRSYLTSRPQ